MFKALFKVELPKPVAVVTKCCGNCLNYRDTGRSRGLCNLKGVRVAVMSAPGCFVQRGE